MFESQVAASNFMTTAFRGIFSLLDSVFFGLMNIMYQLFFNVATADIFSNDMIMKFYSRVQLILGVYMVFLLTMSILKGIVNPDEFFDKGKGFENLIKRIVVSLIMLAMITPISIPAARNEYERQINNNGLLFGTLYSLQNRLLSNNTLGRLILGTSSSSSSTFMDENPNDKDSQLNRASREFTWAVVRIFYKVNLIPYDDRAHQDGVEDAALVKNRICQDSNTDTDEFLKAYFDSDGTNKLNEYDYTTLIDSVSTTCDTSNLPIVGIIKKIKAYTGGDKYLVAYTYALGGIVALIFSIILLSFSVDVAVRSIKLAVLRLIAPIPIISYMNPDKGKDSSFNAWVKTLSTTYLDLFLRLAIIYFVLFIIESMISGGIQINTTGGVVGGLSVILIWIALFIFAFKAPQFIKEALGIKSDGFKFMGGMSAIIAGAGIAGGVATGLRAAGEENRTLSDAAEARGEHRSGLRNFGHSLASAIGGGVMAGYAGTKAALGKNASVGSVMSAQNKMNSLRTGGSTLWGGVGSQAQKVLTGSSKVDRLESDLKDQEDKLKIREDALKNRDALLKTNQDINARRKSIMDRVSSKAVDSDKTTGTYNGITGNYRQYHSAFEAAKGGNTYTRNINGHDEKFFRFNGQEIALADGGDVDLGLLDANKDNYYEQALSDTSFDNSITNDRVAFESASGQNIEATFGGSNGIKAVYGNVNNSNKNESEAINRERKSINDERISINEQRNDFKYKQAQANSNRFGTK